MARRVAYKKKKQNRAGILLVSLVLVMMLIVVAVKSVELTEKKAYYASGKQNYQPRLRQNRNVRLK